MRRLGGARTEWVAIVTSTSLWRADAVKELSNHVADRDRFLISVSLLPFGQEHVYAFVGDSPAVPDWTAYIDRGGPSLLRTSDPALLEACTRGGLGTAVLAVPKTVPAVVLGQVFNRSFPADGSRDLIDMNPDYWPSLIFGALEAVDSLAAAQVLEIHGIPMRPEVPWPGAAAPLEEERR